MEHPDKVTKSWRFLGFGVELGARILAEIGDDRARVAEAGALKAYAGSVPVTAFLSRRVRRGRWSLTGFP